MYGYAAVLAALRLHAQSLAANARSERPTPQWETAAGSWRVSKEDAFKVARIYPR